jgi:general stress protein 26
MTPEYVFEHARRPRPSPCQIDVTLSPQEDLTIWFGTSPKSRKIRDILQDSWVTLSFHDPTDTAYMALFSSAQVEDDLNERLQRWREE